jgi:hypothetical protein
MPKGLVKVGKQKTMSASTGLLFVPFLRASLLHLSEFVLRNISSINSLGGEIYLLEGNVLLLLGTRNALSVDFDALR